MQYIIRHKMCIFRILLVCFYLLVVLGVILVANAHAQKKLGFASANSSFRIAIFADLHYGENAWTDWGPLQDQKSSKVMATVLDKESPGVEQMTDCYFQGTSRVDMLKMDAQQSLSHSSFGPKSLWPSVSNYYLEIASYKYSKSPAALLYFLDSGGGSYPEVISKNQAKWFQQTAAQKNPNSRIPEIVFWHIPSQAYKEIAPRVGTPIKDPCVGSINLERVDSQTAEWGIMDILTNRTSVKAVFVGHNHGLDWCCPCKNLWLCFARHTGYGGYGSWPRGARILELVEGNSELKSWIRMEDGTTHSHMTITSA
ncbi:probable inactive purple acid phosphatase 16 isoform X2 [Cryptomeria japonica]|uniref:probable inactive purple acid phosphatase 16 isoform X2 n=1 Tax=Cryptomeria japonica TaxID=3369 RepID=UPI0025AD2E8C|nr:probable inactive purple acid phosphatase 16 isoform X2 [Cryptomeria japonica]